MTSLKGGQAFIERDTRSSTQNTTSAPPHNKMRQKVVILGGGISGLTSAWSLARNSPQYDILLLEASHRMGGWVHSERMADTEAVHELGPRSVRVAQTSGKIALAMVCLVNTAGQMT